jgi:hypothetical protein
MLMSSTMSGFKIIYGNAKCFSDIVRLNVFLVLSGSIVIIIIFLF